MTTTELPPKVEGPAAWTRAEMTADDSWRVRLSDAEVAEVEAAATPLAAGGAYIAGMTRDDFPLPTLGPRIAEWADGLLHGRGVLHVTGLTVGPDDVRRAAAIFCGIGLHLGHPRSQNGKGHVLGHVCDLGLSTTDPNVRIYQTTERQNYHTDSCDVAGLMCLKPAKRGGESGVVSSMAIFNATRDESPDLLA